MSLCMSSSPPTYIHVLGFTKEHKKSVKMASKKVYFLTVWASENREDLQSLGKVVDIEYGKRCLCVSWCTHGS